MQLSSTPVTPDILHACSETGQWLGKRDRRRRYCPHCGAEEICNTTFYRVHLKRQCVCPPSDGLAASRSGASSPSGAAASPTSQRGDVHDGESCHDATAPSSSGGDAASDEDSQCSDLDEVLSTCSSDLQGLLGELQFSDPSPSLLTPRDVWSAQYVPEVMKWRAATQRACRSWKQTTLATLQTSFHSRSSRTRRKTHGRNQISQHALVCFAQRPTNL